MNDLMNRAEFFRYMFKKSSSVALQFTEHLFEPLRRAGDTATEMLADKLIPASRYENRPLLVSSVKPPLYLVGEVGKNLTALAAECPRDRFPLTYLPAEEAFYCSVCRAKHYLAYGDKKVSADLPAFPLAVKEEYIYLIHCNGGDK